jgi:large subunit ribosomal protein L30e
MTDLNKIIKNKIRDDKVIIGFNLVSKLLKTGKIGKIIYANNFPQNKVKVIKHNSKISGVEVIEYPKDGMELGLVCGKPFSVGIIGIKGSDK